jgi:predicted site-specific integrase-resolvase
MLVGYARVSTVDQNLDLQLSALREVGCEKLYQDQISGTKINRPGLSMALEVLRKNDTLVVWKLDRLGRTVKGLIVTWSSKCIHPVKQLFSFFPIYFQIDWGSYSQDMNAIYSCYKT